MHEIVVLGAGYAGLTAATSLIGRRPGGVRITVVEANEHFTERLRLHQAVTGQPVEHRSLPEVLGPSLVTARVDTIDATARTIRLGDGRVECPAPGSGKPDPAGAGGVRAAGGVRVRSRRDRRGGGPLGGDRPAGRTPGPGARAGAAAAVPGHPGRHRRVTERFLAAAGGGDLNTLMELLAPDVTLWTDGGGKVRQAFRPVTGPDRVGAWFAAFGGRSYEGVAAAGMSAVVAGVNGGSGIVFSGAGRMLATVVLDLDADGRISAIHNVANPGKLTAIASGTVHPGRWRRDEPAARE